MISLRRLPIRQKVSAIIMLTTASALAVAITAFTIYDYITLRNGTINDLQMLAGMVAAKSAAAVIFKDGEAAQEILSTVRVNPSIIGGAILSNDGHPFAVYGTWPVPGDRGRTQEAFKPIEYQGERVGMLVLSSDLREVRNGMRVNVIAGSIVMAAALLVALLMTSALQRLVTQPLLALAGAAKRVQREKNFTIRVAEGPQLGRDELRAVLQAFNEMLDEIEERDEVLRRHQAELEREVLARTAELRTAVEHNQAILDSAGEGIFGLDPRGVVTFMNPSAARILGCDVFGVVGADFHGSMHGEAPPLPECNICSVTLVPAVRTGRVTLLRCDRTGEMPIEYTSSTLVGPGGAAGGVVVTFRDISERLAVERMKDEFVSTVSHELRTPLTAIRGALGLLGTGLLGNHSPKGQRMLEIALANTERLGRLINDILDLEKMESGRVELNRRPISIADVLKQSAEALQPMADRAGIRVEVSADAAELLIDPDRIQQMLINLISNAIKFSPPETAIDVTGRVDGDRYLVAVRDEGRGIPDDKLETVFERFKQIDASDSRDKGGTGLGLAICRSIAEAHGGKIWASRGEPRGSVFTFTLPMAAAPADAAEPCQAGDHHDVLIIEDDFDLARVLAAALEESGIHSEHAATGRDAIAILEQRMPSLIVLDLVLPELDGFRIVAWIRERMPSARIPLLVYSAREVTTAEQELLTLGPTEFITKSRVSIEEFEARIAHLLLDGTEGRNAA